ncbi:hypothetical protein yrohd0001_32260 [Yersinia rohdei ATCC 43380]|nr:hypothetical protein yrohd0001_32260 [Yersinia rohdei ATCC 43380]
MVALLTSLYIEWVFLITPLRIKAFFHTDPVSLITAIIFTHLF